MSTKSKLPTKAQKEAELGFLSRIADAAEGLTKSSGGTTTEDLTEYGIRYIVGQSSSAGERVMRGADGVIQTWDITFTPNVGTDGTADTVTITDDPFSYIDLFSPTLWTNKLGYKFRRWKRFYKGIQYIGVYVYKWVCRVQKYSFYELPRAFMRNGVPYWNYVDSSVYEGGTETVTVDDSTLTVLTSKSGMNPAHNITRTAAFNYAKNVGTALGIDTDSEYYSIETASEINEIKVWLAEIKWGGRNGQATYQGVCNITSHTWNTSADSTIAAFDSDTNTIYFTNSHDLRVGQEVVINHSATESYYHKVTESGTVTGTITDGVFTASDDGTTYYYVVLDGEIASTITITDLEPRPLPTGETEAINALSGTLLNNGKYSFKEFGIENIYGNIWKHVLDVTIADYVPYVCTDITAWTDTSTPADNSAFEKCDYTVCETSQSYVREMDFDPSHPDVVLPVTVGGSSSTYYADYYWVSSGSRTALYGGPLGHGSHCGLFCWALDPAVGYSYWHIGARLSHYAL